MLLGEQDALVIEALHDKEASPTSDEGLSVFYFVLYLLPDLISVVMAEVILRL